MKITIIYSNCHLFFFHFAGYTNCNTRSPLWSWVLTNKHYQDWIELGTFRCKNNVKGAEHVILGLF